MRDGVLGNLKNTAQHSLIDKLTSFLRILALAQVSVLDGNKYTTMCREAGEQCLEILEECKVRFAVLSSLESLDLSR